VFDVVGMLLLVFFDGDGNMVLVCGGGAEEYLMVMVPEECYLLFDVVVDVDGGVFVFEFV